MKGIGSVVSLILQEFDYNLDYRNIDFRAEPERYRIGKGEQGVLLVQPYKDELLPPWRFKTPDIAEKSSRALYKKFLAYLKEDDFVGADMARKFLQMGWTRARRYANHRGGRKYDQKSGEVLSREIDSIKAESAAIFYRVYVRARNHPKYKRLREKHVAESP